MNFFYFFKQPDIDQGVAQYQETPGAILLDVRTEQEYQEVHIPGSKNVPLQRLDKMDALAENKDTHLFVYCHSGSRSRQAVSLLHHMGYSNVQNIGGIAAYRGKVER